MRGVLVGKLKANERLWNTHAPIIVGTPSTIVEFVKHHKLRLMNLDLLVYEEMDALFRRGSGTLDHLRELYRTGRVVTKRLIAIPNDAVPSSIRINTVSLADGISSMKVGGWSHPVDIVFKTINRTETTFLIRSVQRSWQPYPRALSQPFSSSSERMSGAQWVKTRLSDSMGERLIGVPA
ncbi:hypothetical protein BDV19DRAFT_363519 [Aspergillus venezuelensis]